MTDQPGYKPLGGKSYGSIPHLPGSRLGPGEHHCHPGQERIATVKPRDKNDLIVIQEKLDGSNVGILRIGANIIPITRSGYVANTSKYLQHTLFYDWVMRTPEYWIDKLYDGERFCGEWMAQAHGTIYNRLESPLYIFDIIREDKRIGWSEFSERTSELKTVKTIFTEPRTPFGVLLTIPPTGFFGAIGGIEGLVYRVYRRDAFDFICKYVRPDKIDGFYLPKEDGEHEVWNFQIYSKPKTGDER